MLKKIKFRLMFLLLSVVILQLTLVPYAVIGKMKIDLMFGLFVLFVLKFPNIEAIPLAFIVGFVQGIFSNNYFGIEIIALSIPALFLPAIIKKADTRIFMVRAILLFLSLVAAYCAVIVSMAIAQQSFTLLCVHISEVIPSALYTTFICMCFEGILNKCVPRITKQYELF